MTPTSTDPTDAGGPAGMGAGHDPSGPAFRARRARPDRFRCTVLAVVIVLAVVCATLVAASLATGPRLRSAVLDSSATTRTGATLRLTLDVPIAHPDASQLRVSPAIDATATVSGSVVSVVFGAPLASSTRYTVELAAVESSFGSPRSTIAYRFTTDAAAYWYLDRSGSDDVVYSATLDRGAATPVFRAPAIQSFVRAASALVVATAADGTASSTTSELQVVDTVTGAAAPIALPAEGRVDALAADPSGATVAVVFTSTETAVSPEYDHALFTVDFTGGGLLPIQGLAGPLDGVEGIGFLDATAIGSGTPLAVHERSATTSVVDVTGANPVVPLGGFPDWYGISTDGTRVVVADASGPLAVDAVTGEQQRLPSSALDGVEPYGGDLVLLRGGVRVQNIAIPDASDTAFQTLVVRDDGTASTPLWTHPDGAGRVLRMTASLNDQFIALELDPDLATGSSDGYGVNALPDDVQTVIVDATTGATQRFAAGADLQW